MLLLLPLLWCSSCEDELDLPDIKASNKIVLLGELIANDSIYLRAGQSIPLSKSSSLTFSLPSGLSVQVTPALNPAINLSSNNDEFANKLHTLPFYNSYVLQPGTVYTVDASQPQMEHAQAAVKIPGPFLATIVDTASVYVNGLSLLRLRVQIFDNGNEANYYTLEGVKQFLDIDGTFEINSQTYTVSQSKHYYDSLIGAGVPVDVTWDTTKQRTMARVNIYTDDERTENLKVGNAQSASRRILLSDRSINGLIYTTQVYLDKTVFIAGNDSTRGQILFRVRSVSEEYFNYLKGYESFEPSGSFNSIAQPVTIPGNVKGGVGIVGGVYQIQYRYLFDKWFE